jgi:hypothetical protein
MIIEKLFRSLLLILKVLRPINVDGQAKGEIRLYHVLTAEYNDEDKWKQLIDFVDTEANKRRKRDYHQSF